MKKLMMILAVSCFVPAGAALASEVFGTVSEAGKPLPAGVPLKLECEGGAASGVTDEFGSYSLKTPATGDCRLSLTHKGASPSLKVTLYEKPSRYDLVVKGEAGKLTLTRK
ncbi:MAG: hypothetical protein ABI682_14725 [Acidobacteriota bacterium]